METALFTVSYLIDVEEKLLKGTVAADSFNERVFQKLSKNRRKKIDETHSAKWEKSSFIVLNPKKMNCGKCNSCGGWTTDKEKENPVNGLSDGATVDGLLFCVQCLPKDHKLAF